MSDWTKNCLFSVSGIWLCSLTHSNLPISGRMSSLALILEKKATTHCQQLLSHFGLRLSSITFVFPPSSSPASKAVHFFTSCIVAMQGEWLYSPGEWDGRQRSDPQRCRGGSKGGRWSGQTVYTTQEEPHRENPGYQTSQRPQRWDCASIATDCQVYN